MEYQYNVLVYYDIIQSALYIVFKLPQSASYYWSNTASSQDDKCYCFRKTMQYKNVKQETVGEHVILMTHEAMT